jgi:hypothetical protein
VHVAQSRVGAPAGIQVKFRLPKKYSPKSAAANGTPAPFLGLHGDSVAVKTQNEQSFEVVVQLDEQI